MTSTTQLSTLLFEWTTAIIETNKNDIKSLLKKEPEVLWTPIPHTLDDFGQLRKKLIDMQRLGSSFQPLCAIHFICLLFHSFESDNIECCQLLNYLIDQSSLHDLNTRYWGDCNNSTFHLACFLGNETIARLLIEKGVSMTSSNDLGYTPKDVISSTAFSDQLSKLQKTQHRPNYITPDRFKLLKELATDNKPVGLEPTTSEHRLKQEGRFFRKGLVSESKQKVLTEDDDQQIANDFEKSRRQMEVAQLVKKLAVKSNPLYQKYEKRAFYTAPLPKKLDASFFEQQPESDPIILHRPRQQSSETHELSTDAAEVQQRKERLRSSIIIVPRSSSSMGEPDRKESTALLEDILLESSEESATEDDDDVDNDQPEEPDTIEIPVQIVTHVEEDAEEDTHQPLASNDSGIDVKETTHGEETVEKEESDIDEPLPAEVVAALTIVNDDNEPSDTKRRSGSQKASWTMSLSSWAAILDREFNIMEDNKKEQIKEEKVLEEQNDKTLLENETTALSLNFGDFETPVIPKPRLLSSKTLVESPPVTTIMKKQANRKKSIYHTNTTAASTLTLTTPGSIHLDKSRSDSGKLYLHVNGIQNLILPKPKNRAYVRCVVSDGRFEYMSRYELLQDTIPFNYECIIDAYHPEEMIITISIHIRPDYYMRKPRIIPFTRLWFSRKKNKEAKSLSRYVNKEDGALGQARFALTHMLPVCTENSYPAGFHCFNAWSTNKKRRRLRKKSKKKKDVLKVVGNFDVEMLYLPTGQQVSSFKKKKKRFLWINQVFRYCLEVCKNIKNGWIIIQQIAILLFKYNTNKKLY